jgi:4-hydroxy-tetrahydrodipicolinate synthase
LNQPKENPVTAFKGVYPAVITPMDAKGELAPDVLGQVLEYNIAGGADGFWIAGGSGESVLLSDEENKRIAEIAAQTCQGRAITIMHVGAATTVRAAALAEHAAQVGCDAICCVPPFFYRRNDAEIVEHYRVVAAAADLPLFAYNLPSCTGIDLSPSLMRRIQDAVPQLKGLKHSSPVFNNIAVFASMGLSCFTGSGPLMLPALTLGACGCVDGWPGLAPQRWAAVWQAYQKGDLDAAAQAQADASALMALYDKNLGIGFHALLKHVTGRILGTDCGLPRPPALPLNEEQQAHIDKTAVGLGLYA